MNNFTIKERMGKLSDEELVEELLNASYDYKGSCYQKDKDIYLAHKAELISRLTAGEEAIKKVKELEKELKKWEESRDGVMSHVEELELKVMNLRCCGNCKRYYDNGMQTYCFANKTVKASRPNYCCDNWRFDGKKERNRSSY